jgi:hypothetical protein
MTPCVFIVCFRLELDANPAGPFFDSQVLVIWETGVADLIGKKLFILVRMTVKKRAATVLPPCAKLIKLP